MEKLEFNQLSQGGFAGLIERRFVMDQRVFGGRKNPDTFDGLGNFVYLADANFLPHGETGMHPHREVDVISVMVDGRISHAGSLEHGQQIVAGQSQVQRAGGEGFAHNEINPDTEQNQMIQLWVLPDQHGEPAGYQVFEPNVGELQHIYGGKKGQGDRFYSETSISVANLNAGQSVQLDGEVMMYISKGNGTVNNEPVTARTLLRMASGVEFEAHSDAQVILVYTTKEPTERPHE